MKFAEHLQAHITPEWRKQYINYEEMKAMLYLAVEEAPSTEAAEAEDILRHFKHFDEQFFHFCDRELEKINTFYSEKLAEATRKFASLRSELSLAAQKTSDKSKERRMFGKRELEGRSLSGRKLQDMKLAFSEFYLSLILLQNYQNLNFTGFRKILKKHDKLLTNDCGSKYREEQVEASHFFTNTDIARLINETEVTVTQELEGGDRQRAMKRLRVPPLGEQQSPWTTFKVGLFSGSFIILFIAVILSAAFHEGSGENLRTAFKLYRGPLLVVEFLFLMGLNVYGWRSSGVNHVLIFELDPRSHLSEQDIMELAAVMGVVWSLSLLSFIYSASLSIPPYVNPLALVLIMFLFLINPVKSFRYDARLWTIKLIWRLFTAPFHHVGFADFWLADQFNSLVVVFIDLHFLVYFYLTNGDWLMAGDNHQFNSMTFLTSRAIVNCIPAWIRFAQCLRRYRDSKEVFPHLVNAGKYSTTFFAVFFGTLQNLYGDEYESIMDSPYFYLWLVSSIISSCYAYTWDIKMDWGFLDPGAGDNTFLREEIVYSSKVFYYFAIIEDLVLRFVWALNLMLAESGVANMDLLISCTAPLEVFRRFVWNFFRLENEHLNNCGKFRAVRDISVAPIDASDHTQIVRMMDEENGVLNRNTKKKVKKNAKDDKKPLLKQSPFHQIQINIPPAATGAVA